jgi:hypothetical protein
MQIEGLRPPAEASFPRVAVCGLPKCSARCLRALSDLRSSAPFDQLSSLCGPLAWRRISSETEVSVDARVICDRQLRVKTLHHLH